MRFVGTGPSALGSSHERPIRAGGGGKKVGADPDARLTDHGLRDGEDAPVRRVERLGDVFCQRHMWALVVSHRDQGGSIIKRHSRERVGCPAHLYSSMSAACRTGYAKRPSRRSASEMLSTDVADFVAS